MVNPLPAFANAAQREKVAVIFPFYERTPEGKLFNSALVIDESGAIVGKYRKMSIPAIRRVVDSSETPADEQYYFTPGDLGFPVFEVAGLRVGVLICYDRHFPEAARALGLQGADIVFVPTATYRKWIRKVWEAELTGRTRSRIATTSRELIGSGLKKVALPIGLISDPPW